MSWDRPNYAIPGLMPESSPKWDSLKLAEESLRRLDPVITGSWWVGQLLTIARDPAVYGALASVQLVWRNGSLRGDVGAIWRTGVELTITSAPNWSFKLNEGNVDLPEGEWWATVECTDAAGKVAKPFALVLPVTPDPYSSNNPEPTDAIALSGDRDFEIYRYTDWEGCDIFCRDDVGDPVPLAGWSAYAQMRSSSSSSTVVYDFEPVIAADDADGKVTLPAISHTTTATIPAGVYMWDLILQNPDGDRLPPILSGIVTVRTPISHA